jgi:SNF2 family DNA or RNA helicase
LFHGLGSGKTLTGLSSLEGDSVIVTPASLRTNIQDTVKKFNLPDQKRTTISFEQASKGMPKGNTLLVDEAHRIGISNTKRSKSILSASGDFDRVILMSGSPIRNKPHEIAPLINSLHFGKKVLPLSEHGFNDSFVEKKIAETTILEKLRGIKGGETFSMKNKKDFLKSIENKIDYHEPNSEDFPAVTEQTVKVEMSPRQEALYDDFARNARGDIAYKVRTGKAMTAEEKKHANSFLNATRMVSNTGIPYGMSENTPKVNEIVKRLKNSNKKDIVYSTYLDGGLHPVSENLSRSKVKHSIFDGSLSDKEKKAIVDKFNKDKKGVLLLSGAGAEGLDLKGV